MRVEKLEYHSLSLFAYLLYYAHCFVLYWIELLLSRYLYAMLYLAGGLRVEYTLDCRDFYYI